METGGWKECVTASTQDGTFAGQNRREDSLWELRIWPAKLADQEAEPSSENAANGTAVFDPWIATAKSGVQKRYA